MLNTERRLNTMMLVWITVMLFYQLVSAQRNAVSQPDPLITVDAGGNVTLRCFKLENSEPVVWYQQKVGQKPRIIVTVIKEPSYEDTFKPPKFILENERTSCHLTISTVGPSDEAMYYCGYRNFFTRFGNGTFLAVKGDGGEKVSVVQHDVRDSVPAGASVTLQCSVLSESRTAEHQVLWFRAASSQSHPSQIIYTHPNSSQQCESGSSTHSCVYNFSKNILSPDDAGTYYCAAALCGKIVFGNRTQVRLRKFPEHEVICLAGVVAVCMVVIVAEALIICKMRNSDKSQVRPQQDSVAENTPDQDRDAGDVIYTALHFNKKNPKRVTRKRDQPASCVYAEVSYTT